MLYIAALAQGMGVPAELISDADDLAGAIESVGALLLAGYHHFDEVGRLCRKGALDGAGQIDRLT